MKTVPGLFLAIALVSTAAKTALAYHFSPRDALVRLHGKLTFTPNEGGQPFTCSVTLDLKTKNNQIKTANFPHGDCNGVFLFELPWIVRLTNANSGNISSGAFISSGGNCVQQAEQFQITDGVWTLPGGCLSGTLNSRPSTGIVK